MIVLVARPKIERVGYHVLYRRSNRHGEWSVRVEPDGLQIDCFHRPTFVHLHSPGDYDHPRPLPTCTEHFVLNVVRAHIARHGTVRVDDLVRELTQE